MGRHFKRVAAGCRRNSFQGLELFFPRVGKAAEPNRLSKKESPLAKKQAGTLPAKPFTSKTFRVSLDSMRYLRFFEVFLFSATLRAAPISGKVFECSSSCNTVIGVADFGIVDVTAGDACVFLHRTSPWLVYYMIVPRFSINAIRRLASSSASLNSSSASSGAVFSRVV